MMVGVGVDKLVKGQFIINEVILLFRVGERGVHSLELVECFSTIKTVFAEKVQLAYLASWCCVLSHPLDHYSLFIFFLSEEAVVA